MEGLLSTGPTLSSLDIMVEEIPVNRMDWSTGCFAHKFGRKVCDSQNRNWNRTLYQY